MDDETRDVCTVNVALLAPAATVTLEGTVATDVLLLESDTTVSDGAGPLNFTVPCEVPPPRTEVGFRVSDDSVTPEDDPGDTMIVAFCELPSVAVMVAVVAALTLPVVMLKVAFVVPAATVTVAGTLATDGLLLESVTAVLAVGAAASPTLPWDVVPDVTLFGLIVSDETGIEPLPPAVMVSVAYCVDPLSAAEMVAVVVLDTTLVEIENVPVV